MRRLGQLKRLPPASPDQTTLPQAPLGEGSSIPVEFEERAGNAHPRAELQLSQHDDTLPGSVPGAAPRGGALEPLENAPIAVFRGGPRRDEAAKPDAEAPLGERSSIPAALLLRQRLSLDHPSEEHAGNAHPRAEPKLDPRDDTLTGSVHENREYSGGETGSICATSTTPQGSGPAAQGELTRAQSIDSKQGSVDHSKKRDASGPTEEPAACTLRETEWCDNVTSVWPSHEQIQGFLAGTLAQRKEQTDMDSKDDIPMAAMAGAFALTDGQ